MIWNEEKQKFEQLTAEEQTFFDYAYKKGFAQGSKKHDNPSEEMSNTTQSFDLSTIKAFMQEALNEAITPLQAEFEKAKQETLKASKESFLSKQSVKLPEIYKQMVQGEDEASWQNSYKEALAQFQNDFKTAGEFGAPTPAAQDKKVSPKSFSKMTIQEKMALFKEDPELYKQLQDKAK